MQKLRLLFLTIKEILEDKLKSDISKISIIKLLKEELNLSYK